MQLPNLGRQGGFRRADLTVFSISSWNLARFPSKFLHIFKVSSVFHCILHSNIRFILSAMHKRRGKLSKKLFWAPKYTLSLITQELLLVILWDFLWRLRALLLMYSTQKIGTFAVVEARNAPCPMEWGCPKDRSMTVIEDFRRSNLKAFTWFDFNLSWFDSADGYPKYSEMYVYMNESTFSNLIWIRFSPNKETYTSCRSPYVTNSNEQVWSEVWFWPSGLIFENPLLSLKWDRTSLPRLPCLTSWVAFDKQYGSLRISIFSTVSRRDEI